MRGAEVNRREADASGERACVTPHTSVAALPRRTGLRIIGVLGGRPGRHQSGEAGFIWIYREIMGRWRSRKAVGGAAGARLKPLHRTKTAGRYMRIMDFWGGDVYDFGAEVFFGWSNFAENEDIDILEVIFWVGWRGGWLKYKVSRRRREVGEAKASTQDQDGGASGKWK